METNMETFNDDFICKICNKTYKNKSGIWKHNKKYHIQKLIKNVNLNGNTVNQSQPKSVHNENQIKFYECDKCNKKFNTRQARWKHEKTCENNNSNNLKEENDLLKKQLEENKKDLEEFKKQMESQLASQMESIKNLLCKEAKIHPKTLQKLNKDLLNKNINNGSINNGNIGSIINNNSVIHNTFVKFGDVDFGKILNEKQKLHILKQPFMSLEESIKMIHFNDKLPEYNNIYITNMRDNLAYIFDGKQFVSVNKNEVISELIDNHAGEIELLFDTNKEKLKDRISKRIEAFLELLNSSDEYVDAANKTHLNYKAYKIGDIKRLIYDQSDSKKLAELKKIPLNCIEPENDDDNDDESEPKLKTVKANYKQKEIDV
jgi:hypothetical protein